MELTNLTRGILRTVGQSHPPPSSDDMPGDVDECELDPNLCGMEAGCFNTMGSYLCLCHDLQPVGQNHSCDKDRFISVSTSTTDPSVMNNEPPPRPTEGSFGSHQLLGMISKTNNLHQRNSTDSANDLSAAQNTSGISSLQSSVSTETNYTAVLASVFAFAATCAIVLGLYTWYRGRKNLPLVPLCLARGRTRRLVSSYALEKCLQQYVTNPNYYSNSPDRTLTSALREVEIPQENVAFLEEIGEGCFGKVYKGTYTNREGITVPVAVKVLKDGATAEARADFEREVVIMASFQHENILKLIGVVVKDFSSTHCMVFEYMHLGDLAELLRSNSPWFRIGRERSSMNLTQDNLIFISTQIARGMVYLSSQHFVHRDLATRNCLVDETLNVKISDFGMSRDIYTSDYYKITGSRMLPIRWMAPESITYGKFSLESDVWAYGVVLWEIFTFGKQPYYGHSNDEVVKLILQGILLSSPENCPAFICNIMAGCWKTEPRHRLSFDEIYDILLQNGIENDQVDDPQTVEVEPSTAEISLDPDNYLRVYSTSTTSL